MDALVGGIPSFHQPSSLLYSFYDDNTNVSTKTKYIVGASRNGGIQIRYLSPWYLLVLLGKQTLGDDSGRDARGRASVSAHNQQGASPCRANVLRLVTGDNRVAARQGGKQSEVNDQSVMRAVTKGPR